MAMAELKVSEAKLRLLPGNLPAAGYFTLTNTGNQPVVLTGAQSPAFAQVMMPRWKTAWPACSTSLRSR